MALAYLYDPLKQWQDVRGVNNVNGWLEVFISGTQERAVAYSDFGGTLLPDRIGIDNDGRAVVIVDSEKAYRVEVHTANGDLLFTQYPVWTQQSGGGVIGSFVDIESSNGSLDVQKTVVGATTIYDLSVATDSSEGLDWIKTNGYTTNDGKLVPTYQEGPMVVGEYGIALNGGMYYHVTARLSASVTAMPVYNEFAVTFSGMKDGGDTESYLTRNFVADCSTELSQQYEVSFDVMPEQNVELFASVSGLESGVSVGLLDIEVHRVYSGIPDIPDGMATKEWVHEELSGYQQVLTAGPGIELSGSMVSVDFDDVQGKLEAGTNITITNNVISATVPEYADADWNAASGEPGYIHNKPVERELVAGNNISIETTDQTVTISATAEPQVNADWDATSGVAQVLNKPDLSVYATEAELSGYQEVLTPGTGIDITNNTISVDTTTIATQSDLSTGLAGKQDTLTAGDNITITNNVISATVPEYADADWDAASGEPGYIHNKPDIGLFEATYGQTTYAEIMDAINERKIVFCPGQGADSVNRMGTLTNFYTNPGSEYVEFEFYKSKTGTGVNDTVVIYRVDGNDNWIMDERDVKAGNISYPVTDVEVNGSSVVSGGVASVTVPAQVQSDWDATSGISQILNRPDMVSLVAGENITITKEGSTLTISGEAGGGADWDAASGEPGYIHNKPEIPPDNVFIATYGSTTYQELSAAHTAGKAIFVTNVSGALSAVIPMTIFSVNPAMVMFSSVIGSSEYRAKIDQGVWSSTTVSMQADWDEASQLSPAYIANKPTIVTPVNADWDATSGLSEILHKPDLSIYAQSADLATVATTGSYNSLTDKPTIPAAQVNADWDATSGIAQILNRPEETTLVAGENVTITESGSTITISAQGGGAEQVNADWDATSGVSEILHKPDLSIYAQSADLATVATTGSYNSLTDLPTIPAAQVQTDWDATSGMGQLLNRPDLVDIVAGPGIVVDNPDGNTLRVSMMDGYETVLWSGSDTTVALSEPYTNFEKIRVVYNTNDNCVYEAIFYSAQSGTTFTVNASNCNSSNTYIKTARFSIASQAITFHSATTVSFSSSGFAGYSTSNPVTLLKVVGVHRIANN